MKVKVKYCVVAQFGEYTCNFFSTTLKKAEKNRISLEKKGYAVSDVYTIPLSVLPEPAFGCSSIKDICATCSKLNLDGHCAHEEIVGVDGCSYYTNYSKNLRYE